VIGVDLDDGRARDRLGEPALAAGGYEVVLRGDDDGGRDVDLADPGVRRVAPDRGRGLEHGDGARPAQLRRRPRAQRLAVDAPPDGAIADAAPHVAGYEAGGARHDRHRHEHRLLAGVPGEVP
jgi:hypothetical protein